MTTTTKDGSEAIEMEDAPASQPGFLAEKLQDGDEALEILQNQYLEYTPEEEKKLRWKIDLRLVSVMLIVNGIQFVDKLVCCYFELQVNLNLIYFKANMLVDYRICCDIWSRYRSSPKGAGV
jgi:hypothetical protein